MAEETVDEVQDSIPDDQGEQTQESTEEVDVVALQAENARLQKIAQDQKGRADKAEIQLKKAKQPQQEASNSPISDEKYERLELKIAGHSEDEVNSIMDLGGLKALDNPLVKEAIAIQRRKSKSQDATPSGTAKSPIFQKFSERDLRNMPLAELEKIIPQE